MKKEKTLIKFLKHKKANCTELEQAIIEDILDHGNIECYMNDVIKCGCVSGAVNMLIYNDDCKAFYIEHLDDISDYIEQLQDEYGEINNRYKNAIYVFHSWLVYEEITRQLLEEFESLQD